MLNGKVVLDCGCGDGEITSVLAKHAQRVVAVDLSNAVFKAKREAKEKNITNLELIKCDLLNLPIKGDTFDVIHSCGVLHHTPDPKGGFKGLSELLKNNGRIGIWVYNARNHHWKQNLAEETRKAISALPIRPFNLQNAALKLILPVFLLAQMTSKKKYKQNWKTKMLHLYDSLSHPYASRHTPQEVFAWFEENGITHRLDFEDDIGFSVYGDKEIK
jgi:ubiquinone/menaquinone biosynthesis C-methylase UbiE